jgi:hypothetical protein
MKERVATITEEEIGQRTGCPADFSADLRTITELVSAQFSSHHDVGNLACRP